MGTAIQHATSFMESRRVLSRLIAMRTAKQLNQRQIAEEIGWTASKVSRIERGIDNELNLETIVEYSLAMGIDLQITIRNGQMEVEAV